MTDNIKDIFSELGNDNPEMQKTLEQMRSIMSANQERIDRQGEFDKILFEFFKIHEKELKDISYFISGYINIVQSQFLHESIYEGIDDTETIRKLRGFVDLINNIGEFQDLRNSGKEHL